MNISKRVAQCLMTAVILITAMTATAQSPSTTLEGAWKVSIAFNQTEVPPCAPAGTIAIGTSPQGGTLIADSCWGFESAGYGVWTRKANNQFGITFIGNSFAQGGLVESSYKVVATVSLGASGNTFFGPFQTQILDLAGNVLDTFTGTVSGVRIVAEP